MCFILNPTGFSHGYENIIPVPANIRTHNDIYIYRVGLPLLERAPARVGVRARDDVVGGGSTARMHRVMVGSYVGSYAFMHTEFE
jgi:hypothetical protein